MVLPRKTDQNSVTSQETYFIGKTNEIETRLTAAETTLRDHSSQHISGGTDEIPVADTSRTGLLPVLSGFYKDVLRGDGTWDPIKVTVLDGGTPVGDQGGVNFIGGLNSVLSLSNDAVNSRVNVTVGVTSTPNFSAIRDTNGNTSLNILAIPSAVNYVSVRNASAGTAVRVIAQGSDTDIGLRLDPKGAGKVTVGLNQVITPVDAVAIDANAKVDVALEGVSIGKRRQINFLTGSNINYNITDDAGNERVDVEISSTGGGSGLTRDEIMIVQSYGGY